MNNTKINISVVSKSFIQTENKNRNNGTKITTSKNQLQRKNKQIKILHFVEARKATVIGVLLRID